MNTLQNTNKTNKTNTKRLPKTLGKLSLNALLMTSLATAMFTTTAYADDYVIDNKGMHASIQFKISHLGYSWLWGRFNDFSGTFSYDEKDAGASKVKVVVKTGSVDSNHAERDKHLRSDDFLDVKKFPEATFVSTGFVEGKDGKATLKGKLTLHGVTKDVELDVVKIGAGKDPWGGYRRGFEGSARLKLKDYGIKKDLGPASAELELIIVLEGIKQ
jgi:polyisoprenoid-binding protein YceI